MTTDQAAGPLTVIGIDCAAQPENVGIALGRRSQGATRVEMVYSGKPMSWDGLVEHTADLIEKAESSSTLLALDAPLGWPQALAETLPAHFAGRAPRFTANEMFRRRTDDVVKEKLNKQPLDVGADKIARATHAALRFLESLREATGLAMPLAWSPGHATGVSAIEVYPAATLIAYGLLPSLSYKKSTNERRKLMDGLADVVELGEAARNEMVARHDLLDAAVCVIAGVDFAEGNVVKPTSEEIDRARREGWIWFKPLRLS
ncbi:MAG: DUF429 domain-containing protein [Acidimicrobiia bacterium]|nr:DUF429 domain-containing protein [Acidimicrobiia bacterium]